MKKTMSTIFITFAILLLLVSSAQAYATYDWVTTAVRPEDAGYTIRAEWTIDDDEFRSGSFTSTSGDHLVAFVEGMLDNGQPFSIQYYPWLLEHDEVLTGTLSADRQHITSLHSSYFEDVVTLWDMNFDGSLSFSATLADGGFEFGMFFPDGWPHPVNDPFGRGTYMQEGMWTLRDDPAAVPEPTTGILLGLGLATFAFWKMKVRGR